MIEWTKLSTPDCLTQDPNLVYIVPYDEGSKIWFKGEECRIEDATVQEIIDKFNTIGCTSFQLTKEEIEIMIEEFKKENNNEKM
jgi:hypothetical protein